MKKIISFIITLFLVLSFSSQTFATGTSNNGWKTPTLTNGLSFSATLDNGKVYTSWKSFSNLNLSGDFKYYKVIRSSTVSDPVYPDNGYIKYESNVSSTSYTDNSPKTGVNYYRVCAMTHSLDRYCSNVVKIYINSDTSTISNTSYTTTSTTANISNSLKIKANNILSKFYSKLESKYSTNEKRVYILGKIIEKLETLKYKKASLKGVISYMIEKIKERKNKYEDDFSDLENIFDDF